MEGKEVVVVEAVRSAFGRAKKGSLAKVRPDDLGTFVVKGLMEKSGVDPALVEDLYCGCGFPEGEQGMNMGRNIALMAGLPFEVSGATICRYCGSGSEAINTAAMYTAMGMGEVFIAGGAESMSMVPMGGLHPEKSMNAVLFSQLQQYPRAFTMLQTAQYVAEAHKVSRKDMDEYAARSQEKAAKARDAGKFKEQIIPIPIGKDEMFDTDECIRFPVNMEKMAALQPLSPPITEGHTESYITAGNACPTNDGAAFVLLMSREKADELGLKPMAKIVSCATAGVGPFEMGIGPIPASRKALERAGLKVDDIDLWEINEAFASQVLASMRELGFSEDRLNVNGGAIAIGHPFGATGGRLTTMLLHEMKDRDCRYGLVSMCVGGGMGVSTIFEKV